MEILCGLSLWKSFLEICYGIIFRKSLMEILYGNSLLKCVMEICYGNMLWESVINCKEKRIAGRRSFLMPCGMCVCVCFFGWRIAMEIMMDSFYGNILWK